MKSCCQYCEERTVNCHSKCEKYKAFCDEMEKIKMQRMRMLECTGIVVERSYRRKKIARIK